jgi:hypothetical protein
MTTMDKIARRKLSLLDLASELSNVSRACKITGYSRQQFYEIIAAGVLAGCVAVEGPSGPRARQPDTG